MQEFAKLRQRPKVSDVIVFQIQPGQLAQLGKRLHVDNLISVKL